MIMVGEGFAADGTGEVGFPWSAIGWTNTRPGVKSN